MGVADTCPYCGQPRNTDTSPRARHFTCIEGCRNYRFSNSMVESLTNLLSTMEKHSFDPRSENGFVQFPDVRSAHVELELAKLRGVE